MVNSLTKQTLHLFYFQNTTTRKNTSETECRLRTPSALGWATSVTAPYSWVLCSSFHLICAVKRKSGFPLASVPLNHPHLVSLWGPWQRTPEFVPKVLTHARVEHGVHTAVEEGQADHYWSDLSGPLMDRLVKVCILVIIDVLLLHFDEFSDVKRQPADEECQNESQDKTIWLHLPLPFALQPTDTHSDGYIATCDHKEWDQKADQES